ncbi:MAG: hypothetical protein KGJ77_05295 [Acidobacteriota bacterium]|nr:hypothetical protein [Acidobacteriota bacterium]
MTGSDRRAGPGAPSGPGACCTGCGLPTDACEGCRRPLDPPRFCPHCGGRLAVRVTPAGYRATCRAHGALELA